MTSVTGLGSAAVARWRHEDHRPNAGEKELRRAADRAIWEVRKGLAWAELRLSHLERVLRQLRVLDPKKAKKV